MILQTILIIILGVSVFSGNLKRIETASKGISQLIDQCSEKFSVRFKIVIVGNHSDLHKVAEKVMKMSNSSLTIQNIDIKRNKINRMYVLLNKTESQVFIFDGPIAIGEQNFFHESFFRDAILISYFYTKNTKDLEWKLPYPLYKNFQNLLFHRTNEQLAMVKIIQFSLESCQPDYKVVSVFSLKLNSWTVALKNLIQPYDSFFGCYVEIWAPQQS